MNMEELLKDPRVLGGIGGLVLIIIVVVVRSRSAKARRLAREAAARQLAEAKRKAIANLRYLRDAMKAAGTGIGPIVEGVGGDTGHAEVIGHFRKSTGHRFNIRYPDIDAIKGIVRRVGMDAAPVIDLQHSLRPLRRKLDDYNAGKLDGDKTPIATAKGLQKDLQKIVVLANMCLKAYE
ncbi:MAG: hypothetical protein ACYTG4_04255 [Planctomycetota bacterium]